MFSIPPFRRNILIATLLCLLASLLPTAAWAAKPPIAGRVLFLGDSITFAGEYVALIETAWRMQNADTPIDILNLGLPSETVSGLSEPGHAGGAFPRPDLHERLARVLDQIHPDVVVACYGMNDGIYHPLSEERFEAYKNGITKLIEATKQRNIKLIVLTPAFFDAMPIHERLLPAGRDSYPQPYVDYDDVLQTYSEWLLSIRSEEMPVIDIHRAMKEAVQSRREQDPKFTFATDGVHPNSAGHRVIAETIAKEWHLNLNEGDNDKKLLQQQVYQLVSERQKVLKHAWLSETKHLRPGIEPGLPIKSAQTKAEEIDSAIFKLLRTP